MKLQMRPHETPGLLITFCGLDGCGKTTLIRRLTRYLEELEVPAFLTKQPTDAVRQSEIFRTYMATPAHDAYDYRALSLYCASDRVQHSNRVIRPRLERGETVVSDRYFYSCLANLRARGYEQDRWIYEISASIPKPDLAFFLDVDVDTAIRRVRSRASERDRYIDVPLQHRLRREYREIAAENGGIPIPTDRGEEESFDRVKEAVAGVLRYV